MMHLGVGLRSKKTENSGEAEQWKSRIAKKPRSIQAEARECREAESKDAGNQESTKNAQDGEKKT